MISIIVATDDDLLIGKKDSSNGMPWHNKEDLQHFKKTTLHQTILMGKTTYMAIGRPLPHRKTIVVTRGELDDERVEVMEQYNFRYAQLEDFKYGMPTFASIDVSFISLRHMFNALKNVIAPDGVIVSLIKPQFEAGKDDVGKHGIVKDPKVHKRVIKEVIGYANDNGFSLKGLTFSPITGGEGNIEFLGYFVNDHQENSDYCIDDVVTEAHKHFNESR